MSAASGIPAILVLSRDGTNHAVTIAGMTERTSTAKRGARSEDLDWLLIHDDRLGPYVRARLVGGGWPTLQLHVDPAPKPIDDWQVTHVIFPLPRKVRLRASRLWRIASEIDARLEVAIRLLEGIPDGDGANVLLNRRYDLRLVRSSAYLQELLRGPESLPVDRVRALAINVQVPRYFGCVSLISDTYHFDVLLDTTSLITDIRTVAVVVRSELLSAQAEEYAYALADKLSAGAVA